MENPPAPALWLESSGSGTTSHEDTPVIVPGVDGLRVATWSAHDPDGSPRVQVGPLGPVGPVRPVRPVRPTGPLGNRNGRLGRRRRPGQSGRAVHEVLDGLAPGAVLAVLPSDTDNALELVAEARRCGRLERLWVTSPDVTLLETVRGDSPATRLLHNCDPAVQPRGAEHHAARLRELEVQGVIVPADRVSAGLVALMHRFDRMVGVEGAQYARMVRAALVAGVDIVCGPSSEVLLEPLG